MVGHDDDKAEGRVRSERDQSQKFRQNESHIIGQVLQELVPDSTLSQ